MCVPSTAKILTLNGGPLCKDAYCPLVQSHAARQLPVFSSHWPYPTPSLPLTHPLDPTPTHTSKRRHRHIGILLGLIM